MDRTEQAGTATDAEFLHRSESSRRGCGVKARRSSPVVTMSRMANNALRELLNRLRWDARQESSSVMLSVRVRRGGVERVEEHSFTTVVAVGARGVTLLDGTFLPFHRVVAVSADKRTLWPRGADT